MNLLEKTDEEIIKIAEPFWNNLIISSNKKDYSGFTRDFSAEMLYGANEIEIGKQWSTNELLVNLSSDKTCLGCLRRGSYVSVLYKQTSTKIPGEFLGRLVLGVEENAIKGGAGSAVAEFLADNNLKVSLLNFGISDEFVQHGSPDHQKVSSGLGKEEITEKIRKRLEQL